MVSLRSGRSTIGEDTNVQKPKARILRLILKTPSTPADQSKPASTPTLQKTISGRITKPNNKITTSRHEKAKRVESQPISTAVKQSQNKVRQYRPRLTQSLRVKFTKVRYALLPQSIQDQDYRIIRQQKRGLNFKGLYFPPPLRQYHNRYHFKFGHNPFQHRSLTGPTVAEQWTVYNLMKKDLEENFNKECFLDQPDASTNSLQNGPLHMSDELSVDNLVKVILSVSTENSLAIRQHAQLCSKFTYTVKGTEVKGTVPNYHKMRLCPPDELRAALNIAGFHMQRQRAFHAILNEIYEQNTSRMRPWEVLPEGNPAEEGDFVPGLLSLDYLRGDGLTKQQRFDLLVKFDLIAVKTGCCLLAFNLKIPVFVVDTHVHHMVRKLQWIPEDCLDADRACMFLDTMMPDELKFGLHQAFWHHRINCVRCMPRANPTSLAYQQRMCPLEHLMKRNVRPMSKSIVRSDGVKNTQAKDKKVTPQLKLEKKAPGSIKFLGLHYKMAADKGYALRKVDIDDNFGDGSRQNKDSTANYFWGLKEYTHANDVVKFEDALGAIGVTMEQYEARFAKKARASNPNSKSKSKPRKKSMPTKAAKHTDKKKLSNASDNEFDIDNDHESDEDFALSEDDMDWDD